MKRKKAEIVLRKIPLEEFIDFLIELYDRGALFIDIGGTPDVEQDSLNVYVKDEYIDEENDGFKIEHLKELSSEEDFTLLI